MKLTTDPVLVSPIRTIPTRKENYEVTTLDEVMMVTRGNISAAAKLLGVNRGTVRKYLGMKDEQLVKIKEDENGDKHYTLYCKRGF